MSIRQTIFAFFAIAAIFVSAYPIRSVIGIRHSSFICDESSPLPPLPEGFVAVQYIESTGEQYIDTGIPMDYGHVTFGGMIQASEQGKGGFGFGFYLKAITSYTRYFGIEENSNARAMFVVYGRATTYRNPFLSGMDVNKCFVSFVTHNVEFGDETYSFTSVDWDASNIFIFGTGLTFGSVRVYGMWIKYNDEFAREFIPCRSGNEGFLYDTVSGEVFGNIGTGAFVIGSDL